MEHEVRRLEGLGQLGFGFQVCTREERGNRDEAELFVDPEPRELFVGARRLDVYLRESGLGWVIKLAGLLGELDLSLLTRAYQPTGRKAFHPRTMLGLIVYGILGRQWSLRELEALARRDVGAWWLCGGHQPDHSTIGKFIELHAEVLSEEFFVALVRHLAVRLRLGPTVVAGDGTVIEAAASCYRLLRAEAAQQVAEAAQTEAAVEPGNAQLKRKAELAAAAAQLGAKRVARRWAYSGGDAAAVKVSIAEPEAVYQRSKDGTNRLSYKPVVLASADGLIVGQRVEPSSERAAVAPALGQHMAVFGCAPPTLLLDGGFASNTLWLALVEAGIDLLCPSGRTETEGDWQKRSSRPGKFSKRVFRYDSERDVYHCPAGRELIFATAQRDAVGRRYREYLGRQCEGCPLRSQCTDAVRGRKLKRYEGEELRELMAEVLSHPAARAKYRRRQAIVEPCFAELRERQGLRRFHRRGLNAVRAEFALHCIAFNLKRAVGHSLLVVVVLLPSGRFSTAPRTLFSAALYESAA